MSNQDSESFDEDMLPEYDFSDAEIGKYVNRYRRKSPMARLTAEAAARAGCDSRNRDREEAQ